MYSYGLIQYSGMHNLMVKVHVYYFVMLIYFEKNIKSKSIRVLCIKQL